MYHLWVDSGIDFWVDFQSHTTQSAKKIFKLKRNTIYLCQIVRADNFDAFSLKGPLASFFDILVDFEVEENYNKQWQYAHENHSHPIGDSRINGMFPHV